MCFEIKTSEFVWTKMSSMLASDNINSSIGQGVQTPPYSKLSWVFDCFEGPQILTNWQIVLIIPVMLVHLQQSVWRLNLAELLLLQHVVYALKG